MIDKTSILISAILLMLVTEVAAAAIRRYFPERQGHLGALFMQVPAWILSAWGLVYVVTSNMTANEFNGAIFTITSLIIFAAMYGVAAGGLLCAMAINYSRVPSGMREAVKLLGMAVLSVILGILPLLVSVYL